MSVDKLNISSGDHIPMVNFDPETGIFEIKGMSRPEDVTKIYNPIIDWLKKYAQSPAPNTKIDFKYAYFNTASARKIYEMLTVLDDIHTSGKSSVEVNWYYDEPDIDMKMAGEEYDDILTVDINYIAVPFE